jgi:pilus assembly protein CpaC
MRLLTFVSLGLLAGSLFAARAEAQRTDTERLSLRVGEQVTIPAVGVQSYSEGLPGIVDVRLPADGRQFVIVALREGETSLLLIYSDGRQVRYTITVRAREEATVQADVPVRENIRLDFYFVQLTQSYSHQLGIGFPGSIGGAGVARFTMAVDLLGPALQNAQLAVTNQALPRIDIAQGSGWARILRQVMVVTANGTEAEIDSGGEVNFRVTGVGGGSIQRVEFGTDLRMTPRFDAQTRRIEITINADVSDLTEASADGIPGRTRTTLTSVVNLELGQSIVLGGLVGMNGRESQSGLPGLSQIPILGVLFGTNQRRDENQENLLFVVPTVVQAVPRSQADRIQEALTIYQRFGSIGGPGLNDIELFEPSPPGYE